MNSLKQQKEFIKVPERGKEAAKIAKFDNKTDISDK